VQTFNRKPVIQSRETKPFRQIGYSVKDAAAASGIGTSRLYEAMRAGLVEHRKHGRKTIVLAASLEAYVESLPSGYSPAPMKKAA
jgi:hypothetical protein